MYVAVSYISDKYVPGDVIGDDLPENTLQWLMKAGAVIEKSAPVEAEAPRQAGAPEPEAPEEEAALPEEDAAQPEDEYDDEAEVPEIDVMDGIVQAAQEEPEEVKPAPKKRTRRPSGRSAKGGRAK